MSRTGERAHAVPVDRLAVRRLGVAGHTAVPGVGPAAPKAIQVTHRDSPAERATSVAAASGAGEHLAPSVPEGSSSMQVVVGVNGSSRSAVALRWALDNAAEQGWSIDVVTAWPDPDDVFVHEVPGHYCAPRGRAVGEQDRVLVDAGLSGTAPVTMRSFIDNAPAVGALAARGADALMIVVGRADPDRPGRRRPDVGEACAVLVSCPVVVVGGPAASTQGHTRR